LAAVTGIKHVIHQNHKNGDIKPILSIKWNAQRENRITQHKKSQRDESDCVIDDIVLDGRKTHTLYIRLDHEKQGIF
jgi:hypothetical protein